MGLRDLFSRGGLPAQSRALTEGDLFWGTGGAPEFYDVGGDNALRISAVYSATSLIADMLSGLSIDVFRRERPGATPVVIDPPRWMSQPDDRLSDFDFWHQGITSALLRGNAFGLVFRDHTSQGAPVREVEWQHPSWVSVDESAWLPAYRVQGSLPLYDERTRSGGGIVHVRGYLKAGTVIGLNPIANFRHQMETARNALQTARDFYDQRAQPSGVLSSKAQLPQGKATEVKAQLRSEMEPGSVLVLDGTNWAWEQLSLSPADMLFLDAIEATANQIAAIYRVEPEDVGGKATNSLKYSTVEGNQRKLTLRTLLSWARRFEQGMSPLLDDPRDYMRFNFDELIRPNALELEKVTSERLNNGTQTLTEARAARNLPPLTADEVATWQAWFRTSKGSYADTMPLADILAQLSKGGD